MTEGRAATVGFVGLGRMGLPTGYDVSPAARSAAAQLTGVTVTEDLLDVAGAEVVVLMLPSSDLVDRVLLDGGLLDRLAPGTVLIDMGSSEPSRTKDLAAAAELRGVSMLDAPVSGGVGGAEKGTLTIMVGGPQAAFEQVAQIFAELGANVMSAGATPGAGHAVKALNNLMSAGHLLLSSEAILAGRAFGIDPAVMLEIVNTSSGRSGSTQGKWPSFVLPGTYDSGFALALMVKDMRIALALEGEVGTPGPLSEVAVRLWETAADALPADADHTEIVRWLEQRATEQAAEPQDKESV
jgi:3-hydroxyisobutyrate dehydrogenase